jgi:cytochrome oxidase assembly protein ShyY1
VSSFRFLLSRRWLLFAAAVVVLAAATVWLGRWQFDRLEDRKESNAVIRANEDRSPMSVDEVLAPGQPVAEDEEWRLVTATGEYDAAETVVVRYRTRDGAPGVDVVVPLVTAGGTTLLVDRGWLQTEATGADRGNIPDPPAGEVEVVGWARADGSGDSTTVTDLSTRAISSAAIGEAIDREVYGGFVELKSENGEAANGLEPVELPELDNGPHFFYGLQWWFFGVLAVFGFCYLAYDEWKRGPRGARRRTEPARAQSARSMPPSTGSITPETNEDAGDSRKAAARPNSAGSP